MLIEEQKIGGGPGFALYLKMDTDATPPTCHGYRLSVTGGKSPKIQVGNKTFRQVGSHEVTLPVAIACPTINGINEETGTAYSVWSIPGGIGWSGRHA